MRDLVRLQALRAPPRTSRSEERDDRRLSETPVGRSFCRDPARRRQYCAWPPLASRSNSRGRVTALPWSVVLTLLQTKGQVAGTVVGCRVDSVVQA